MKKLLLAGASLLAMGVVSASAADLPARMPAKAPAYVAPMAYSWTGFYLGLNGGYGFGRAEFNGGAPGSFNAGGGLFGATVGYNWQTGPLVFGLEGDIDWSGMRGSATCGGITSCDVRNDYLATIRGRLGYAFDRFLPYITAGLAAGDINATRPGFPGGSSSNAGWTVGAGLEFGIASNVSIKAEYLYVDLGDFNCGFNCGLAANGNVSYDANVFRGGLNIRF